MKTNIQPKISTHAIVSSRKNIISHSVNSSFNKSSFIELKDGSIKRIRHKQSYKDLFLEKLNFVPTEMPHSKRRDGSYSSMYQNRNSFISNSGENSMNEGNQSHFIKSNIKTIDNSFSNSQKRLKRLSFANNLRNKLNLSEKKNLIKRKIKKRIGKDNDLDTNNILAEIDNDDENNLIYDDDKMNKRNIKNNINNSKDDYSILKDEETEDKKDIDNLTELKKTLDSALIDVTQNKEEDDTLRLSKNSNTLKSDYRKSNKTLLNDDSFFSKEIENIIKKKNPVSGDFEFFNGETGEKLNNIIVSLDPLSKKESFLIIEGPKDENGNLLPFKKKEYIIKKNYLNEDCAYDKMTGKLLNNIMVPLEEKEIEIIKDNKTGKFIVKDKNNKKELKDIEVIIDPKTGETTFINKLTGKKLNNIIEQIDPKTNKKKYIQYDTKDLKNSQYLIKKEPKTGKEVIIDKNTNQKIDNLIKNIDPVTGEVNFIDKNTGEIYNNIIVTKDLETGEEIYNVIENLKDENGDNLKLKKNYIQVIKDPETNKLIPINKFTGEKMNNLEVIQDKKTGEIKLVNKETGEIIRNLISEKNNETGEETFINYELYKPKNKNQEIILKTNPITNEEILVDKNSGEILNNIIKKIDPKTGETILINKDNGEIIKNIVISKDPISGEDIFIKLENNKDENGNEIPLEEKEIEIIKDNKTGKFIVKDKISFSCLRFNYYFNIF